MKTRALAGKAGHATRGFPPSIIGFFANSYCFSLFFLFPMHLLKYLLFPMRLKNIVQFQWPSLFFSYFQCRL